MIRFLLAFLSWFSAFFRSRHERIYDALQKEPPSLRVVERRPRGTAKVVGRPASAACITVVIIGKRRLKAWLPPGRYSSAISLSMESDPEHLKSPVRTHSRGSL
jgi:hypothetical protein